MSFKKTDKKGKKSPSGIARNTLSTSPPSAGSSCMPEGARAKLLELFGQIENQFEQMYADNSACESIMELFQWQELAVFC